MQCLLEGRRLLERDAYFNVNTQRYAACQRKYGNTVNGAMLITMDCVIICVRCNWKKGIVLCVLYIYPEMGSSMVFQLFGDIVEQAGKQADRLRIKLVKDNISQFLPYPRFLGYLLIGVAYYYQTPCGTALLFDT